MRHEVVVRGGTVVDGTGRHPYVADIGVDGGLISEVGEAVSSGRREIDADGLVVTPGFVDAHTHYDGQATWDETMTPSSHHGVTTVVMGNCGVGFAPVRSQDHSWLVGLMEGVEDIPGKALLEGIRWTWESFPEYLDALDRQPRNINVAVQIAHGPLRAYVMGERGARNEPATAADIATMRRLVSEAVRAGAVGVSTSRTLAHRAIDGEPVPGTYAGLDELRGLLGGLSDAGAGLLEVAPAGLTGDDLDAPGREISWMGELSIETGRPITFLLVQHAANPDQWREVLRLVSEANGRGARISAQVALRPVTRLTGHQSGLNPFSARPTYAKSRELSFAERVDLYRRPEVKASILGERDDPAIGKVLPWNLAAVYPLGDPPNYEPGEQDSVAALAARSGQDPWEYCYELMLRDHGRELLMRPSHNYANGNLDASYEMMLHPDSVIGGSGDGGAHAATICDASSPTSLLSYWCRDRTRGPLLDLASAVRFQTHDTAALCGLDDRGLIAPGLRADLNVIDLGRLEVKRPTMACDLPGGAPRLVQEAEGYVATLVAGQTILEEGVDTGARPGTVVRASRR